VSRQPNTDQLTRYTTTFDLTDALALGGSMGGARALSLASIDVLDGTGRDLRRHHTDRELAWGWSEEPNESERARDRELRLHAADKQLPDP
jgi:hypothetical protein